MHNSLGNTEPLPQKDSHFHNRPFMVFHGDQFANAVLRHVQDPVVLWISQRSLAGNVDHLSDNTKLHSDITRRTILRKLYT